MVVSHTRMYRLVISVSRASGLDRDTLLEIEACVVAALRPGHSVHDHDLGRGHLKLVVHTEEPQAAWEAAKWSGPHQSSTC